MIFPSDERLDVFLRVERLEIVDALAEADVLHRHAQLLRDGNADAAFGRAVELRQDNARQARRLAEDLRCCNPFCPVVASSTKSVSFAASGVSRSMILRSFESSFIRFTLL